MCHGMVECNIIFSGHCDHDLDLWPSCLENYHVTSISLTLFEVGIPKFGMWMHLWKTECRVLLLVTVTLSYVLNFRILCP